MAQDPETHDQGALRRALSAFGRLWGPRLRLDEDLDRPRPRSGSLLECPVCSRDFMCPMDWGTQGSDHWWIEMRCGECGMWTEVVVGNEQAAKLDCALNAQSAVIAEAVDALDAQRMGAEVEAFVAALHRGLIVPTDFVR